MKKIFTFHYLFILLISNCFAQSSNTISYQGLLYINGSILPDGQYQADLNLYQSGSNTLLWAETQLIDVVDGIFNTQLGLESSLDVTLFADNEISLGVSIEGEELSPRINLTATPYSFIAKTVEDDAITSRKIADNEVIKSINGLKDDITINAGNNVQITNDNNGLTISANLSGSSGSSIPTKESFLDPLGFSEEIIVIDPNEAFSLPAGKTIKIIQNPLQPLYFQFNVQEENFPVSSNSNISPSNTFLQVKENMVISQNYIKINENGEEFPISIPGKSTISFSIRNGIDGSQFQLSDGPCGLEREGRNDCSEIYASVYDENIEPTIIVLRSIEGISSTFSVPSERRCFVLTDYEVNGDNNTIAFNGNNLDLRTLPLPFFFSSNTEIMLTGNDIKLIGYLK